jgi:ribosomal RNA-processing protein 12
MTRCVGRGEERGPSNANQVMISSGWWCVDDDMDTDVVAVRSQGNKEDNKDEQQQERYQGGGKGIHRVLSGKKKAEDSGERYKARRAGGDLKKKGKPDPYAYLPLDRQKLNKRKKMKLKGQFTHIMKGARTGSATGAKLAARSRRLKRIH